MINQEIQEVEQEIERYEKQMYWAQSEDDAKGGTKMGKLLIESFKKGIRKLQERRVELRDKQNNLVKHQKK